MPEISVGGGESFSALIFLGIEKNWIKRAEYQDFTSKIFCLTVPKNFRRGILYCCNSFGCRKGLDNRGGSIKIFRR